MKADAQRWLRAICLVLTTLWYSICAPLTPASSAQSDKVMKITGPTRPVTTYR